MIFPTSLLVVVVLQAFCREGANAAKVGGFSDVRQATQSPRLMQVVESVKRDFLESVGWDSVPLFQAISFRSQVVAGTNYLVKVKLGEDQYAHLRIFVPLPHKKERPKLTNFQLNKRLQDDLESMPAVPPPTNNRMGVVGGISGESRSANAEVKNIVAGMKPTYANRYGYSGSKFEAVAFKTQLVNGKNYFVKVRLDDDRYVHLRIHQPLSPQEHCCRLTAVQENKKVDDPIDYFESGDLPPHNPVIDVAMPSTVDHDGTGTVTTTVPIRVDDHDCPPCPPTTQKCCCWPDGSGTVDFPSRSSAMTLTLKISPEIRWIALPAGTDSKNVGDGLQSHSVAVVIDA